MNNETQKVIYAVPNNFQLTGIEDEKAEIAFGILMRSPNAVEVESASKYILEQSGSNIQHMVRLHTAVIYTMCVRWPILSMPDVRKVIAMVFEEVDETDRNDFITEAMSTFDDLLEGCVNPFPVPDLTEEGMDFIRDYDKAGEEPVHLEVMMKLAVGEATAEDIAALDTVLTDNDRRYIGLGLRNMGRIDPFEVITEEEIARYTNLA